MRGGGWRDGICSGGTLNIVDAPDEGAEGLSRCHLGGVNRKEGVSRDGFDRADIRRS